MTAARPAWLVLLVALILSLSGQSVLTQTHWHSPASLSGDLVLADGGQARVGKNAPADVPANCVICREIAHSGHVLVPPPILLDGPAPVAFLADVGHPDAIAPAVLSHRWQSRAPPRSHQA